MKIQIKLVEVSHADSTQAQLQVMEIGSFVGVSIDHAGNTTKHVNRKHEATCEDSNGVQFTPICDGDNFDKCLLDLHGALCDPCKIVKIEGNIIDLKISQRDFDDLTESCKI